MWLMWITCYMHQMHPLIKPKIEFWNPWFLLQLNYHNAPGNKGYEYRTFRSVKSIKSIIIACYYKEAKVSQYKFLENQNYNINQYIGTISRLFFKVLISASEVLTKSIYSFDLQAGLFIFILLNFIGFFSWIALSKDFWYRLSFKVAFLELVFYPLLSIF